MDYFSWERFLSKVFLRLFVSAISDQEVSLLYGRIFLDARFRLVSSPQIWERTDCAREVHTSAMTPHDGPSLTRFFLMGCQVSLENLTVRFDHNFPSFLTKDFLG